MTDQPVVFSSVKGAGVFADRNARHRRFMEDAHTMEDKFNGDEKQGFFAVFDGHGGKTAALFCQSNFHKILQEELASHSAEELDKDEKINEILVKAYAKTDEAMKPSVPAAGACAVTALIRVKSTGQRMIYCANAGDSRAILCRDGKGVLLSVDHKATNEEEAQRVITAGGFIKNERVNGLIAISRALGDHCMKTFIPSDPYLAHVELQPVDTFLILACDGVWDVIPTQEAVDLIVNDTDPTLMAKKLLVQAIKGGSTDNITVMVLVL